MTESWYSTILTNSYSIAEANRRLDLLREFLEESLFKTEGTAGDRKVQFVAFARGRAAAVDIEAIAAWDPKFIAAFTSENVYDLVRDTKHAINALPLFTLYVPVPLSSAQIARIGAWCRKNIQQEIMLDLRVDPAVVGGCAFAYNNAYHDYSFAYFIEKSRPALADVVQTYAKR